MNNIVVIDKFTGTTPDALETISKAVADRLDAGFCFVSNSLAYYKRENGENVGVSLFVWRK